MRLHFASRPQEEKTMQMEVTILSTDHIKPSSPVPSHPTTFKLSLLDQLIPLPYASLILFYSSNTELNHHLSASFKLQLLKRSLSQTLTQLYPFAGKLKDDLTIDCSDEGAYYVETQVNCSLSKFLARPDLSSLHEFLPVKLAAKETFVGTNISNIQANVFRCGGIALGICISHRILDGAAFSAFLRAWSATARQGNAAVVPDFATTSLFPADDLWLRDTMVTLDSFFRKGKTTTRRFLFDGAAIDTLKNTARGSQSKRPTRVEVVSAFIWERCMVAWETRNGIPRPSVLTHIVNLRRRQDPPLPDHSIGNIIWKSSAKCTANSDKSFPVLVQEVKKSISKIDRHFVEQLRDAKGNSAVAESLREMSGTVGLGSEKGVDRLACTSQCKLGFYEADFGWGRPVWVSGTALSEAALNLVILADTREGDGIEAWVALDESEMAVLEDDTELQRLASIDPSPLTYNLKRSRF